MLSAKFTLDCCEDSDCEDENLETLELEIKTGVLTIEMTISEPNLCSKNAYERLANGKDVELPFCDSNGIVIISQTNKIVEFQVGKYGAGGDGNIKVQLPFSECETAFKMMADHILQRSADF
jgi:hypothetical protein